MGSEMCIRDRVDPLGTGGREQESKRKVVTGLAAAGREEEMARATLNAFGQDPLAGPLQQGT